MKKMSIADLAVNVVEPSSTQWAVIKQHLTALGVTRLERFADGKSALADMGKFQPDLVISTMYLPDMTGTGLVQAMRGTPALESIPFMLVSSEHSDYYLEPIRQAGVVAILPKPFQQSELKSALYSTLEFLEPDNEALKEIDLDSLHVLVVDDSITARKHIMRVLNNLGINDIVQATNGREAVETMSQQFFDLIVTDYNMPEMDGQELTRYIREQSQQRSIPVLMVTSEAYSSHLAGVKQLGVSAMCDKPFEPNEVKSLLRKILTA